MFLCCFYGPYLSVPTGRVFDHRLFHRICSYAVFTDPTFLFPQDGCLTKDFFTGYVLNFLWCFYGPYIFVSIGRVFDHRLFHRICSYAVFTDPTFLFPQDGCLIIDIFTGYVLMLFLQSLPFCSHRTSPCRRC